MSLVGPFIALAIFLVGQLIAAVMWGATINTKMDFMLKFQDTVIELQKQFTEAKLSYSTKSEVAVALVAAQSETARALAASEKDVTMEITSALKESLAQYSLLKQQVDAMWPKVDYVTKFINKAEL